jgi:hypothetical protein
LLLCSNLGLEIFSPRLQLYVLILTLMVRLSHLNLTHILHTHLVNFSFVNLVFIFRSSSSTTNPVYVRRVNSLVLVWSLSSHRHSYIGLIFNSRFTI